MGYCASFRLTIPSSCSATREILLEASDGKPIGRVGPLKISDAQRSDFRPPWSRPSSPSRTDAFTTIGVSIRRASPGPQRAITLPARLSKAAARSRSSWSSWKPSAMNGHSRASSGKAWLRWLETRLSKDEILTSYLNTVYLGAGIEAWPQERSSTSASASRIFLCQRRRFSPVS